MGYIYKWGREKVNRARQMCGSGRTRRAASHRSGTLGHVVGVVF